MILDTPPSSVIGDDEIMDELYEEDDLEYVGDLDEVLDNIDDDDDSDGDSVSSDSARVIEDNAACFFNRHTGSVFCGSISSSGDVAVTGGEDDTVYVWKIDTQEVIYENKNHEDSVIIAEFSHDGVYLATGDMGGNMRVVKCPNKENKEEEWKLVWEYQAGDMSLGMWHNAARVLIGGTCTGEIYLWKIPSGDTKVLQGHGSKVECAKLLTDGRRLAAGYEDGTIKIWDLKLSTVLYAIQGDQGHANSITCIDAYHDNNIIVTGGLDGKVVITKSASGKIVGVLDIGSEVEALSFSKDKSTGFLAIGTLDGYLSIWDIGRQSVRHKLTDKTDENASGIVMLIWVDQYLAAACLDGSLRIYDSKTGLLVKTYTGHRKEILDLVYCPATKMFLTTSDDSTARIFKFDVEAS